MSRYIDAEPIQKFIENGLNNLDKEKAFGYDAVAILAEIEYTPTADVKPVVRGKWMFAGDGIVECSECKETYESNVIPRNFCPHCGADMRGENK